MIESSKKVAPWRAAVKTTAQTVYTTPADGPVIVEIRFYLPPPKRLPKGRTRPTVRPDVDKLARSTLDALTGVAFKDDSQVVHLAVSKYYALADGCGARIITTTQAP